MEVVTPYNMDLHIRRFSDKPKIKDLDVDLRLKIYDLLGITGEECSAGDLRIFDQDNDLILIHYLIPEPSVYHVRGIVINIRDEPHIVASSFAYTDDILPSSFETDYLEQYKYIAKAQEGTAIRIFYANEKWYMATHKKLHGENSKWAGPTFGELFESVWGSHEKYPFSDYLSSSLCHIFLLTTPENRLVCRISSPSLTLVGQFERSKNRRMTLTKNLMLEKPHPSVRFQILDQYDTIEDLINEAEKLDIENHTGILLAKETNGLMLCHKLTPLEYVRKRAIRGNEPNFTLRYLQIRCGEAEGITCLDFRKLFPECQNIFDNIEEDLKKLPQHLKKLYMERCHPQRFIIMPKEEYYIVNSIYRKFNRDHSLIKNIQDKLKESDARQLNAMIKHMKNPDKYYADE